MIVFLILTFSSCSNPIAPQLSYEETLLINQEPIDDDIFVQMEFAYQKSSGSSYLNFNPRFSKGLLLSISGVKETEPPERNDEKRIVFMCKKLDVSRDNYFDLYERVRQEKTYADFTIYVMQKIVDNDEPYGAQELIVVIEKENEINVYRETTTSSEIGNFIYPSMKRKDNIVYITNTFAFNSEDNAIIKLNYQEASYLDEFDSIADMQKHVGELLFKDSRLKPYIEYSEYGMYPIKCLFERDNKIYTVYSLGVNTVFIVYNKYTEGIIYAHLIEADIYGCYESLPKIQIDGKLTDPFCSF